MDLFAGEFSDPIPDRFYILTRTWAARTRVRRKRAVSGLRGCFSPIELTGKKL